MCGSQSCEFKTQTSNETGKPTGSDVGYRTLIVPLGGSAHGERKAATHHTCKEPKPKHENRPNTDARTNTLYVEHGPGVCVLQVCNSRNRMVRYISSHLDAHLGGVPQAMEQAALREARLGTRPTERLSKG